MGWAIAAVCLLLLCLGQWALLVKQSKIVDEQMDLLKSQEESITKCTAAWGKLILIPQLKFLLENDGATLVAYHDDPEMQKKGQEAADELQRTIDEIKGLRARH